MTLMPRRVKRQGRIGLSAALRDRGDRRLETGQRLLAEALCGSSSAREKDDSEPNPIVRTAS